MRGVHLDASGFRERPRCADGASAESNGKNESFLDLEPLGIRTTGASDGKLAPSCSLMFHLCRFAMDGISCFRARQCRAGGTPAFSNDSGCCFLMELFVRADSVVEARRQMSVAPTRESRTSGFRAGIPCAGETPVSSNSRFRLKRCCQDLASTVLKGGDQLVWYPYQVKRINGLQGRSTARFWSLFTLSHLKVIPVCADEASALSGEKDPP